MLRDVITVLSYMFIYPHYFRALATSAGWTNPPALLPYFALIVIAPGIAFIGNNGSDLLIG